MCACLPPPPRAMHAHLRTRPHPHAKLASRLNGGGGWACAGIACGTCYSTKCSQARMIMLKGALLCVQPFTAAGVSGKRRAGWALASRMYTPNHTRMHTCMPTLPCVQPCAAADVGGGERAGAALAGALPDGGVRGVRAERGGGAARAATAASALLQRPQHVHTQVRACLWVGGGRCVHAYVCGWGGGGGSGGVLSVLHMYLPRWRLGGNAAMSCGRQSCRLAKLWVPGGGRLRLSQLHTCARPYLPWAVRRAACCCVRSRPVELRCLCRAQRSGPVPYVRALSGVAAPKSKPLYTTSIHIYTHKHARACERTRAHIHTHARARTHTHTHTHTPISARAWEHQP